MFHLINLFFMLNLSFKSKTPESGYSSGFKNYREQVDPTGRVVLVECPNPYEGLSADSFSLQAQIDAGVPLQHFSSIVPDGLSSVDRNNSAAEIFVNSIKSQIKK